MYDVFISHSRQDTEVVKELAGQLRARGVTVFLDIDTLQSGDDWRERITSAVENARASVVVLSPGSSAGGYLSEEVAVAQKTAREGSSLLVPVLIGDVDRTDLPWGLEKFQGVRINGRSDLPDLAQAVADAVHTAEPPAETEPEASSTPASAAVLESALAESEKSLGDEQQSTLTTRANLASAYQDLGRNADAAVLLERTLADCEQILGPDHPSTLTIRANLAGTYLVPRPGRSPFVAAERSSRSTKVGAFSAAVEVVKTGDEITSFLLVSGATVVLWRIWRTRWHGATR
jgi:hypothetical protein